MSSKDPMELIEEAADTDGGLTGIAKKGIGGWLLAVSTAAITGVQEIVDLLVVVPAEAMGDVIDVSAEAVFEDPLGVISTGATETGAAVGEFGFLALPVSVGVVGVTLYGVNLYLQREGTSDLFLGGVSDYIPFVGADEEEED